MASGGLPLWLGTLAIGVSYSLVPAVLWPLASQLVARERLGSALALMTIGLNLGIAGANLAAGHLNDRFAADAANPAGYLPMMALFIAGGIAGFLCALRLREIEGDSPVRRSLMKGTVPFD